MIDIPLPALLNDELERVDAIIEERVRLRPEVEQIAAPHALQPRSARVRAALVLLAARLGAYEREATAHAAAAIELIHAAMLLHDDLVDTAARGRNAASQGEGWESNVALMVGDYLFALAAAEMALAPDARIIALYSQSVMAICEGQLAPVRVLSPLAAAYEQYAYSTDRRVASLFSAACRAGGVCASMPADTLEALGRYGQAIGMALALRADALDYRSGTGAALRAGVITLPLIYAAEAPEFRLDAVDGTWPASPEALSATIAEVQRLGGDLRALREAGRHADRALAEVERLPETPARALLAEIAEGCGHARR
jgi:geranylgeranyl pyrophosphate synthase